MLCLTRFLCNRHCTAKAHPIVLARSTQVRFAASDPFESDFVVPRNRRQGDNSSRRPTERQWDRPIAQRPRYHPDTSPSQKSSTSSTPTSSPATPIASGINPTPLHRIQPMPTRPLLSPLQILRNHMEQQQPIRALEYLESLAAAVKRKNTIERGGSDSDNPTNTGGLSSQVSPSTELIPNYTSAVAIHRLVRAFCAEDLVQHAAKVLDTLPALSIQPLPASYAVLISAYGKIGQLDQAESLFRFAQNQVNQRLKDQEKEKEKEREKEEEEDGMIDSTGDKEQNKRNAGQRQYPNKTGDPQLDFIRSFASPADFDFNHQASDDNTDGGIQDEENSGEKSGPAQEKRVSGNQQLEWLSSADPYRLDNADLSGAKDPSTQAPKGAVHHVLLYTAILDAFIQSGQTQRALLFLREMEMQGIKPSLATYTVLIRACTMERDMNGVQRIMQEMQEDGITPDIAVYNMILEMCIESRKPALLLTTLRQIHQRGLFFNPHTYSAFLLPCARAGDSDTSLAILRHIRESNEPTQLFHYSLALEATTVHGDVRSARAILQQIRADGLVPNDRCLTYAARAFGKGGEPQLAHELLVKTQAQGIRLSHFFLNALLYSWVQASDVAQSKRAFAMMHINKTPPNRTSYNMLIHVLCKQNTAEGLAEALQVSKEMASKYIHPDAYTYDYLLRCMARLKNSELLLKYFQESSNLSSYTVTMVMRTLARHPDAETLARIILIQAEKAAQGFHNAAFQGRPRANNSSERHQQVDYLHTQLAIDEHLSDPTPKPEYDSPKVDAYLASMKTEQRISTLFSWVYPYCSPATAIQVVALLSAEGDGDLRASLIEHIFLREVAQWDSSAGRAVADVAHEASGRNLQTHGGLHRFFACLRHIRALQIPVPRRVLDATLNAWKVRANAPSKHPLSSPPSTKK